MTSSLPSRPAGLRVQVVRALVALVALTAPFSHALAADWIYTVRPGDSLWSITQDYLEGTRYFQRLKDYNKLTDTATVVAGTKLRIPVDWLKAKPASAKIARATGTVEKIPLGSGDSIAVVAGDALQIGDRLRTGSASNAVLGFADGSRMLVLQNSSITFDSLGAFGDTGMVDTTMRLHSGRVENEVITARGAATRFEITTPSAVAAVRGTSFRAAFDESDESARVEVGEGAVGLQAGQDSTALNEGFGIVATAGQPLPPPVQLLPPADLSGIASPLERELWSIEWPVIPGATSYRVQVFDVANLDSPLSNEVVREASLERDAPPDGDYVLKVRGIDADALEGLDAERPLVVNARPIPPPPIRPEEDARVPGPPPLFEWAIPGTTDSVRIQVARDAAFSDVVVSETAMTGLQFQPAELPPGDYFWRLASTGGEGDGPWGDARALRIQAVPAATEAAPPEVAGRDARLTWGRAANAATYDFELADNPEFENPAISETLDAPEYRWKSPGPGTFYYRARGVSDEGVKGAYGPPNRLEMPYLSFDPVFPNPPARN